MKSKNDDISRSPAHGAKTTGAESVREQKRRLTQISSGVFPEDYTVRWFRQRYVDVVGYDH